MENQPSAWEVICGELEKIRLLVSDQPHLRERVQPCLEQIRNAVESALPCSVLPAISMKDYSDGLPAPQALYAMVDAAGAYCEFHGYTFWRNEGQPSWSLTNPLGFDDVMQLRSLDDFERFLIQLRSGHVIGV